MAQSESYLTLKVASPYVHEADNGLCRIQCADMELLGISENSAIGIISRQRTLFKRVKPLRDYDAWKKDVIRMDFPTQHLLPVKEGEYVNVRKAVSKPAEK